MFNVVFTTKRTFKKSKNDDCNVINSTKYAWPFGNLSQN